MHSRPISLVSIIAHSLNHVDPDLAAGHQPPSPFAADNFITQLLIAFFRRVTACLRLKLKPE